MPTLFQNAQTMQCPAISDLFRHWVWIPRGKTQMSAAKAA